MQDKNDLYSNNFTWDISELKVLSKGNNDTCDFDIEVGDIVSLKNKRYLVRIEVINCELKNGITIEYVGKVVNFNASEPIFFNISDIDRKIEKEKFKIK